MAATKTPISTDSAAELHELIGDDATATFENDPVFSDSNPTDRGSSENIQVQRDTDDTEDSEEEDDELEDDDEDLDEEDVDDQEDDDDLEDDGGEDIDDEAEEEDDEEEVGASAGQPQGVGVSADGFRATAFEDDGDEEEEEDEDEDNFVNEGVGDEAVGDGAAEIDDPHTDRGIDAALRMNA
jgi:hypothetical protein